jgi:hypothetical protein
MLYNLSSIYQQSIKVHNPVMRLFILQCHPITVVQFTLLLVIMKRIEGCGWHLLVMEACDQHVRGIILILPVAVYLIWVDVIHIHPFILFCEIEAACKT